MGRRWTIAAGALGTAVLLGVSTAGAQPPPGEFGNGPGPMGGPARFLELSPEQRDLARRIFEEQRPQLRSLAERLRENRRRLHEALARESADALVVGEIVIEGHRLREEGRRMRENGEKAFEGLLTPEQKRKLELLQAARAAGPGGRFGRGWRAEGPPHEDD